MLRAFSSREMAVVNQENAISIISLETLFYSFIMGAYINSLIKIVKLNLKIIQKSFFKILFSFFSVPRPKLIFNRAVFLMVSGIQNFPCITHYLKQPNPKIGDRIYSNAWSLKGASLKSIIILSAHFYVASLRHIVVSRKNITL